MAHIAFIGLGHMGGPMASNLLKSGHRLSAYDLAPASIRTLADQGAEAADSAAAAAKAAEVVISMLPSSPHVEDLYLGQGRLLEAIEPGALVMDCSTIAPDTARKVAAAAQDRGLSMLDAPVSGGVGGAVAGTLTFMVGGDKNTFEQARPYLEQMGKNIFLAGDSGAGQVAKICNNMMLGIQMIGACEALNLGMANGLDPKVLSEIIKPSSGGNWVFSVYNPVPGVMDNVPASKGYEGGFGVDLMFKDLGLAMEAALATRAATPMGSLARSLYAAHSAQGAGKLDFSSIIRFLAGNRS